MEKRKKTTSETIFQICIGIVLIIATVLAVVPFILLISSSFTAEDVLLSKGYGFWPAKFSVYAYEYLLPSSERQLLCLLDHCWHIRSPVRIIPGERS